MTLTDALLVGADAAAAALLVRAGTAKAVAPALGAAAVGELLPGRRGRRPVPTALVRALAAVEMAVALALAVPVLRGPAHLPVLLLGIVFTGAGILGMSRGSTRPCGCFGADSTRPLGVGNVLMGIAILADGVTALRPHGAGWAPGGSSSGRVAALTVIVTCCWLLCSYRGHAYRVVGNLFKQ